MTKSSAPVRPERSIVRVAPGSRSRRLNVRGLLTLGTSIRTCTEPRPATSEYESGPKLVGRSATAIRLPGREQARGVDAVDLVGARGREGSAAPVQRVASGTHEAEQA